MDKETLSNYGWIVVLVLVLAVMLALATPFGTFIAGAIKSTTAGLFNVNQTALGSAGIDVDDLVFENCDHLETELRNITDTYTGDTCCKACGAVLQTGQAVRAKVPEGGKYTAADGTVYNPGDEMPEVVSDGDTYTDGEYMYKYNYYGTAGNSSYWYADPSQNGWGAIWIKYSGMPAPIQSSINGKPLTTMHQTFYGKNGLSTDMYSYIIPDTVTSIYGIFAYCSNLSVPPIIPHGVENMHSAFHGTVLTQMPEIPNSVTNLQSTFLDCKTIVDLSDYVIPDSVTNMFQTFEGCTSLKIAPIIPEGVTDMYNTFEDCTSLTTVPIIPSTVTNMHYTFENCKSLTGTIVINANPTEYGGCFIGVDFQTQKLTLEGSSTMLDRFGTVNNKYCAECNGQHRSLPAGHNCHGGTTTCTRKALCVSCGNEYGDFGVHTGGTATCQQKAVCTVCDNEYGDFGNHTTSNGTCTICGTVTTVIESSHSPYLNNQNSIVLGTWDYSDATSVNITITYQTESTNYDWIYIQSDSNYLNANGQITTSAYKFGGTSKVTKTFTNLDMLTGSVIFRTDSSGNNYHGVTVQITPNY